MSRTPSGPHDDGRLEEDPRRGRARRWRTLAVLSFGLAGVLFVTSAVDSRGGTLRSSSVTDLITLVRDQRSDTDTLARRTAQLNTQVSALSRSVDDSQVKSLQTRIDRDRGPAGLEPVEGQGLTVTLQDAPQDVVDQAITDGKPPTEALLVHQQDIQAVVNALWLGGAKAMTVMDQRIVFTTGIRCAGPTVILHGVPYSPPYVIKAVGDPVELAEALDNSDYIDAYRTVAARYGLGFEAAASGDLDLPGYQGTLAMRFAKPLTTTGASTPRQ